MHKTDSTEEPDIAVEDRTEQLVQEISSADIDASSNLEISLPLHWPVRGHRLGRSTPLCFPIGLALTVLRARAV